MKKSSIFKNNKVKTFLLVYLSIIITYNLYTLIIEFPKGWFAILINGLILLLILSKSSYLKISLRIWSMFFLILIPGLQIVSKIIKKVLNDIYKIELNTFLQTTFFFLIGILIYHYSKTIIIRENKVM